MKSKERDIKPLADVFSKRLKELMIQNEMSQQELSNVLNVLPSTISRYTLGIRIPTLAIVVEIANYFNVSVDYLLGLTDVKYLQRVSGKKRKK